MLKHTHLCCLLLLLSAATLGAYEAILFGDVHFDAADVRDPAVKRPKYQEDEMKRNLALWSKDIPGLLDRAAQKVGKDTAFVAQLGDICQGDCGSGALHEKSLNTVLPKFRERFPSLRFLAIPGNHDIRGKGAAQAYKKVMIPYLSKTLGQALPAGGPVQYAFMQENDLFVFMDCNNPSMAFLQETLAAHPKRRHLFILTHFPVLPISQGAPLWTLFDKQPAVREPLVNLLAENNAVILCAHVHIATFTKWKNDKGAITQVSLFSMFNSTQNTVATTDRNLKNLFQNHMRKTDNPKKRAQQDILARYLQGYTELKDISPAACFAILKPNDTGVVLEMYSTKELTPTHTLTLK